MDSLAKAFLRMVGCQAPTHAVLLSSGTPLPHLQRAPDLAVQDSMMIAPLVHTVAHLLLLLLAPTSAGSPAQWWACQGYRFQS
jgi:hypothetical protein